MANAPLISRKSGIKLNDVRLNKSGSIGTEPMGRIGKSGAMEKFTEVKLGRLGKVDLPSKEGTQRFVRNAKTIGKQMARLPGQTYKYLKNGGLKETFSLKPSYTLHPKK